MEFKESYFITSDGARIFYRYRLASDVACENPGANEVNLSEDDKFDGSNLSAGAANEMSNLASEQANGTDENAELGSSGEGKFEGVKNAARLRKIIAKYKWYATLRQKSN